jgi:hypothetical protein
MIRIINTRSLKHRIVSKCFSAHSFLVSPARQILQYPALRQKQGIWNTFWQFGYKNRLFWSVFKESLRKFYIFDDILRTATTGLYKTTSWPTEKYNTQKVMSNDNYHRHGIYLIFFYLHWLCSPAQAMASFTRFLDHTQRSARVDTAPLDEWSTHRRDLYLTTHNTHNRQTSMTLVGFKTTITADEQP